MSLDTLPSAPVHPTEELLEEYSFGRVSEPALARFEEHLLDCTLCQARLLAIDEYTALMKAGIAAFERERHAAPPSSSAPSAGFVLPRIRSGNLLLAAAFVMVLVSAALVWRMHPASPVDSPPATVKLIAWRGGAGEGSAKAPSDRVLELTIDRTDLPLAPAYRLEVLNSTGRPMWNGAARIVERNISARVANPLQPGAYWVRLYSSGDRSRGDRLQREFGLRIE